MRTYRLGIEVCIAREDWTRSRLLHFDHCAFPPSDSPKRPILLTHATLETLPAQTCEMKCLPELLPSVIPLRQRTKPKRDSITLHNDVEDGN